MLFNSLKKQICIELIISITPETLSQCYQVSSVCVFALRIYETLLVCVMPHPPSKYCLFPSITPSPLSLPLSLLLLSLTPLSLSLSLSLPLFLSPPPFPPSSAWRASSSPLLATAPCCIQRAQGSERSRCVTDSTGSYRVATEDRARALRGDIKGANSSRH